MHNWIQFSRQIKLYDKDCNRYYKNENNSSPIVGDYIKKSDDTSEDYWQVIEINVKDNIPITIKQGLKCYIKISKNDGKNQKIVDPYDYDYINNYNNMIGKIVKIKKLKDPSDKSHKKCLEKNIFPKWVYILFVKNN